jgi:iron complex transport system substrate-binding protein
MTKRSWIYKHAVLLIAILISSFILGACASPAVTTPAEIATNTPEPQPIVLTDAFGKQITLPEPAKRVISLAPSNTEILFAIGAGPQVVGREAFSDFPAEAQSLTDIGGGFGVLNTEAIVALEADLVLAADLTPAEQVQALEELGLTVFFLPNPVDFTSLYENLRTVAKLTGHENETETLIASLQERVAKVEKVVSQAETKPLVFYELDATDANAPYTSGPGTFIDFLITAAGGENLGSSMDGAWVQVSVEELITRNPEIIILGDFTWGGVTPEDLAARSGWQVIEAVINKNVFTIDDILVSRPGPRLVDGLEEMAKLIHPELFK